MFLLPLVGALVLIVLFWMILLPAKPRQFLVAVDHNGYAYTASPRPTTNRLAETGSLACGTEYPCFNRIAFAFDSVVPFVSLGQRDRWHALPRGRTGRAMQSLLWALNIAGWVLATLVGAGFSRVVRNE